MKLVFFETPLFTKILPDYLNDQDYTALQLALLENPNIGDLMPGTGGFRKYGGKILDAEKAREVDLELFITT